MKRFVQLLMVCLWAVLGYSACLNADVPGPVGSVCVQVESDSRQENVGECQSDHRDSHPAGELQEAASYPRLLTENHQQHPRLLGGGRRVGGEVLPWASPRALFPGYSSVHFLSNRYSRGKRLSSAPFESATPSAYYVYALGRLLC